MNASSVWSESLTGDDESVSDDQCWLCRTPWITGAPQWMGWGEVAGRARDARTRCQGTLGDQGHLRDQKENGQQRFNGIVWYCRVSAVVADTVGQMCFLLRKMLTMRCALRMYLLSWRCCTLSPYNARWKVGSSIVGKQNVMWPKEVYWTRWPRRGLNSNCPCTTDSNPASAGRSELGLHL